MAFVKIGDTTLNTFSTKYEVGKALNEKFAKGIGTSLSEFAVVKTVGNAVS